MFTCGTDSFLDMHTACNIAKSYDYVIEEVKLTPKFRKFALNNVFSIVKAFQVSLPEFLHKTGDEVSGDDKEKLLHDSVFWARF